MNPVFGLTALLADSAPPGAIIDGDSRTAQIWQHILNQTEQGDIYRAVLVGLVALFAALIVAALMRGRTIAQGQIPSFGRRLGLQLFVWAIIAGVIYYQSGQILLKRKHKNYEDTLYLPSARYVRSIAMGYDDALASILFIRAIQAYGSGAQFSGKGGRPRLFAHYYDVITDLDPKFYKAYSFGNLMVGEEFRSPGAGLALMVKGVHNLRDDYRIPYEAAFFSQATLEDFDRAVRYLKIAVQASNAPEYLDRQLNYFAIKGGQFRAGVERFLDMFLRAKDADSWFEEHVSRGRLRSTQEDWGIHLIDESIDAYKAKFGKNPKRLEDLLTTTDTFADYEFVNVKGILPIDPEGPSILDELDPMVPFVDQFMKVAPRLFVRVKGKLPPTPTDQGWFYVDDDARGSRRDKSYFLQPMSQTLPDQIVRRIRQVNADQFERNGFISPDMDHLVKELGWKPIPSIQGLPFFYSPYTGEANYAYVLMNQIAAAPNPQMDAAGAELEAMMPVPSGSPLKRPKHNMPMSR